MTKMILTRAQARHALSIRDLTDPLDGPHAMQLLIDALSDALVALWRCTAELHRGHPVVTVEDNYDRLGYPPDGPARDARYTRYVSQVQLLRSHTSAMLPSLLRRTQQSRDVLLLCPGIVYRRDVIDRLHTGEPHQMDLWRIAHRAMSRDDLRDMVCAVVAAALPGHAHRVTDAIHPYTEHGWQIDVQRGAEWIEIGECGLAHRDLLPPGRSGLAMGLGLDRLLMLRKGIDDIRLLRATDPRVAAQMCDLSRYRPVSKYPSIERDLSIAIDEHVTLEEIGDIVRNALGSEAAAIESVELLAETPYDALPSQAHERMGMSPHQKNALVRITLRHLDRALTDAEANAVRNRIYAALHQGSQREWATL